MQLSFGASTFSFIRQEPALESMRRLRRAGYRSIDILAVPGHLWPSDLSDRAVDALRYSLAAEDIIVDSLNPQPVDLNVGSAFAEVREYSVATYGAVIRLASQLGARGVVVVPGRVPPILPPNPRDTLRWAAGSIAELSAIARSEGLEALFVENHPLTAFPTAVALSTLLDEVGADNVKVAYDVANAEYVREDQLGAISLLGNRLGQTHLSDASPGRWAHDVPGTGSVRFGAVLEALRKADFVGVNVVELISQDPMPDYAAAAQVLDIGLV